MLLQVYVSLGYFLKWFALNMKEEGVQNSKNVGADSGGRKWGPKPTEYQMPRLAESYLAKLRPEPLQLVAVWGISRLSLPEATSPISAMRPWGPSSCEHPLHQRRETPAWSSWAIGTKSGGSTQRGASRMFFAPSGFLGCQSRISRARRVISSFRLAVCTTRLRFLRRSRQLIDSTTP